MQHESNLRKSQSSSSMKQKLSLLSNFIKQFKHSTYELIAINVNVNETTIEEKLQKVIKKILMKNFSEMNEMNERDEFQMIIIKD